MYIFIKENIKIIYIGKTKSLKYIEILHQHIAYNIFNKENLDLFKTLLDENAAFWLK